MVSDSVNPRVGSLGCSVCCEGICAGGHLIKCLKRDPTPSRLAGVINIWGGITFVVAHADKLSPHVREDELLLIVPGVRAHQPVGWDHIPWVINTITRYVRRWIEKNRPNNPVIANSIALYRLRCLEQNQRSQNVWDMVET